MNQLRESDQDTIAAISTPLGRGGIGVIRLSGADALAVAGRIFESSRGTEVKDQPSFTAQHGYIVSKKPSDESVKIDEVLLLVMRAPKSYTCEDVVEISAHGGSAVLQAILDLAIRCGARLAARGEFTKRAFLNGRIDLLQAEAVIDLINAKTELGRRWATAQLDGALSKKMKEIKTALLNILIQLEASIDFPEDLVGPEPLGDIQKKLQVLQEEVTELLSKASLGFVVKNGYKIVIAGRPNVGKSSLMNRLSRANRVIVTPFAGTTRDAVEEETQIKGFPIRLMDTAGIQDTEHPIEKEGINRAKAAAAAADLILYVVDGERLWQKEDAALLKDLGDKGKILVVNKSDRPRKLDLQELKKEFHDVKAVSTSCVNDNGTDELENEICCLITHGQVYASDEVLINSSRQKDLLEKTLQNIQNANSACSTHPSPEFAAVDVRLALDHLGQLVGEVVTDDILESLFSQFCIGK